MEASAFPWLESVLAINAAIFLLHAWLDSRQRQALRLPKPPPAVASLYTQKEFDAKRAYNVDKLQFSRVRGLCDFVLNTALLAGGFLPWSWRLAGSAVGVLGWPSEVAQSVAWALIQGGTMLALGLPWSWYSTFVLEARHGFNKTTLGTFVADTAKSVLLGLLLLPPVVAGFTAILQRASPWVGLQLWAFLLALALFMITIYPTAIAPLFNKFMPLEEGPLRQSIESLAASLSFPLKKLFVVDGSRRSAHSNAYQYGFSSNKRIVLYDTLLQQCSQEQVVAVLAHELGHWKLGHMPKLLVAHQLVSLAQLSLFTLVRNAPGVFESFGFAAGERPALGAFLLFQYLVGPVDEVLGWLSNVVSRRFEFQADGFGVELGRGEQLREALIILDKENKESCSASRGKAAFSSSFLPGQHAVGAVNVDALYSSYHHSHPPLLERLAAIDAAMEKGE
ncbi:hypothetical protein ABPG77_001598 [Micractinium sp. CCAP 211/92]